ncbi:MAG: DNA alkylation repair protein [Clostridiales bacterium]|nr:DNA alkylation repair protein [Clostridiales bacterium]
MTYTGLIQILRENSDKQYDEFNNKIINSGVATIGCKIPFLRKIAKSLTLVEVESYPVHQYFEVDLLRGVVVSGSKLSFAEKSVHLLEFANIIENWAVCDCSTVKVPKSEMQDYFDFFVNLLPNEQPFVCRYGVVNLMTSYLDDEHIDKVFSSLATITQCGHYYVDMGVAWLVATAMAKCRDKTVAYMEGEGKNILNKFTYNKALQKMRESYRVSPEDKQWTYTMKIQ